MVFRVTLLAIALSVAVGGGLNTELRADAPEVEPTASPWSTTSSTTEPSTTKPSTTTTEPSTTTIEPPTTTIITTTTIKPSTVSKAPKPRPGSTPANTTELENGLADGVLRTANGLILPILESTETGHRVWTPCALEAEVSLETGTVISRADYVLDAGHGGSEPGAVGRGSQLREKHLNLAVAKKIRSALVGAGYSVVLTREIDVRLPLVTRAEIARALHPKAFISVHFNAGTTQRSSIPGTEIYHQVASADSKRLAGLLYEEVTAVLNQYDIQWVGPSNPGAMSRPNQYGTDYYGALRRTAPDVTSVLTEFAYLSNRAEEALISRPEVQDQFAAAVLTAIQRYEAGTAPDPSVFQAPVPRRDGGRPGGGGGTVGCRDPILE